MANAHPRPPSRGLSARLRSLLAASHPEPAALVTSLTSLLCLVGGRGWGTLVVTAAVGCGQLSVGWTNDYLDRQLDRAAGRADKPLAVGLDSDHGDAQSAFDPAPSSPFGPPPPVGGGGLGGPLLEPWVVRDAAIAAAVAAVVLSLAVGLGFAAAHLTAVGAAMAYNAGLKSRPLSALPYALAFGLLPVAVALSLPQPHLPPAWAVAAGALIGAGGHFTQALPDIDADRRLGVFGLPQLIGSIGSGLAAAGLLAAAALVALLGPGTQGRPGVVIALGAALSVGLAAAVAAAAIRGQARLAFRLTLATAATAVVAFLASGARL